MKRLGVLLIVIMLIPAVLADISVKKDSVVDVVVIGLNQSALFDFEITNIGVDDIFEVYSVAGATLRPKDPFEIKQGYTKNMQVEIWPGNSILQNPGTFNFEYKIKGEKAGIWKDSMAIRIMNLDDALEINSYSINLGAETANIYVKNKVSIPFSDIKVRFKSEFFDFEKQFSVEKFGKKEFIIPLDIEKVQNMTAGQYVLTAEVTSYNAVLTTEQIFEYTEKAEVVTEEEKNGFVIYQTIVKKINEGNLPTVVQVNVKRNVISRLFTTFNADPIDSSRGGFFVEYTFQKEIMPAETFEVKATTNWFYPLIITSFLVIIGLLMNLYFSTNVIVTKKTTFVKTKGGEFALKISLIVKAKDYIEKMKLVDKIPALVKVHERFGAVEPDKIDEKNRRLEWNVDALQKGEERIFSYIIYSKIAPIGKFELPIASILYEKDGKPQQAESNRVFFLTEPTRE